jgi:RNA polymerase sigma factor (sigma-70 family)
VATVLVDPRDREFEELYRRYEPDVHRYALAVSQNEVDAEDVTQQTFMNAYRALLRGEQPRAPLHWLIAIAHNVFRERLRRSSRRPTEVALDENLRAASADESLWSAGDIRHALAHLCPKQRAVIVLRELEGRSYSEIAESLGLSQAATEALAFRARRALREQLEAELTCQEAQAAVARRLDGGLSTSEHGALRAHLRACPACAGAARSRRGRGRQRLGGLAALPFFPLPLPLKSLFGSGATSAGAASAGGGVAVKAAAVAAAGVVATGVGYETVRHVAAHPATAHRSALALHRSPAAPAVRKWSLRHTYVAVRSAVPVRLSRPAEAVTAPRPVARHKHPGAIRAATPANAKSLPDHRRPLSAAPDEAAGAPASKHVPVSHGAATPGRGNHGATHGRKPKPLKQHHVQKVHRRWRSADAPGRTNKASGQHGKSADNGSASAHGNGDGGKAAADASGSTETEALPPQPPDEAAAGGADG